MGELKVDNIEKEWRFRRQKYFVKMKLKGNTFTWDLKAASYGHFRLEL
jgi:hypothetical protein